MLVIGVVGPFYDDSFADNIACGIEDLGHTAVRLAGGRPERFVFSRVAGLAGQAMLRTSAGRSILQSRPLLKAIGEQELDAVIVVEQLNPDLVEAVRQRVPQIAFWFPDAVSNLGRQTMFQASYSAVFTKEPRLAEPAHQLVGLPVHYLAEACNPRWHRVHDVGDPDPHIVVVGNYYPYRIRLLERMHRAGLPLRLYGSRFPSWMPSPELDSSNTGCYAVREVKARAFRSAAAVFNAVHPAEIDGLNCRLFEATACGGTVLTEAKATLDACFDPETEVIVFADFDDLVDKARWCLAHPAEARAIGDKAAARALADHTYGHRLREIFEVLGLSDSVDVPDRPPDA